MDRLVFHPILGIGVVDMNYKYTSAANANPEKYLRLLEKGIIERDVKVYKDLVLYGEPSVEFWIQTDKPVTPEVVEIFPAKVGHIVDVGNYQCYTWTVGILDDIRDYARRFYPDWQIMDKEPAMLEIDGVPDICKGETWSFTLDNITLSMVQSDCYCIENNWEQRAGYWITDCISRNKRLVHSDILDYNKEFDIDSI